MSWNNQTPRVWVVEVTEEAAEAARRLPDHGTPLGITNDDDVHRARVQELRRQGETPPFLDDVRLKGFSPAPRYVSPTSFAPDLLLKSYILVSPKL